MSEELYFNDELRKCLNAAGLSDCGENDAWNYWYQRVYKAHNQTIDRVTEVQRAENAKLRKLVDGITFCSTTSSRSDDCIGCPLLDQSTYNYRCTKTECMQDLGIEVDA